MNENHFQLKFPDVGPAIVVISWLQEAGLFVNNGMGISPLPWAELAAWREETHRKLPYWVIPLLRELSEAYVAEYHEAKSPECTAPYTDKTEFNREQISNGFKSLFRRMAKKSTEPSD